MSPAIGSTLRRLDINGGTVALAKPDESLSGPRFDIAARRRGYLKSFCKGAETLHGRLPDRHQNVNCFQSHFRDVLRITVNQMVVSRIWGTVAAAGDHEDGNR